MIRSAATGGLQTVFGIALAIAVVFLLSAVFVGVLLWRAPYGYQDEDGFHHGEKPPRPPPEEREDDAA